jgi:hypothetical protein
MKAKTTRITLTKSQAESSVGTQLIDLILSMCHDGELDITEIETLHMFLRRNESASINAIAFLRSITREVVSDGAIDQFEAYKLKQAFERVVPKEARGVVSTHLESIGLPGTGDDDPRSWTRHEATAKQLDYIAALGGTATPRMTKGEASVMIDELLERRPPTPRQMMLLRFFDRLDLTGRTKEEISAWIDELYYKTPAAERAWDKFKLATKHDPHGQDPTVVPIGACSQYMQAPSGSLARLLFIAGAILFVGLVGVLWEVLRTK